MGKKRNPSKQRTDWERRVLNKNRGVKILNEKDTEGCSTSPTGEANQRKSRKK